MACRNQNRHRPTMFVCLPERTLCSVVCRPSDGSSSLLTGGCDGSTTATTGGGASNPSGPIDYSLPLCDICLAAAAAAAARAAQPQKNRREDNDDTTGAAALSSGEDAAEGATPTPITTTTMFQTNQPSSTSAFGASGSGGNKGGISMGATTSGVTSPAWQPATATSSIANSPSSFLPPTTTTTNTTTVGSNPTNKNNNNNSNNNSSSTSTPLSQQQQQQKFVPQAQPPAGMFTTTMSSSAFPMTTGRKASFFDASEIIPRLFLGGESDVVEEELSSRKIQYILNVANDVESPTHFQGVTVKHLRLRDHSDEPIQAHFQEATDFIHEAVITKRVGVLVHCKLGISRSSTMVMAYLMRFGTQEQFAVPSKHGATAAGGMMGGTSGSSNESMMISPTSTVSYDEAMRLSAASNVIVPNIQPGLSYEAAFDLVKSRRPLVSPNLGFILALQEYDYQLQTMRPLSLAGGMVMISDPSSCNLDGVTLVVKATGEEINEEKFRHVEVLNISPKPSLQDVHDVLVRIEECMSVSSGSMQKQAPNKKTTMQQQQQPPTIMMSSPPSSLTDSSSLTPVLRPATTGTVPGPSSGGVEFFPTRCTTLSCSTSPQGGSTHSSDTDHEHTCGYAAGDIDAGSDASMTGGSLGGSRQHTEPGPVGSVGGAGSAAIAAGPAGGGKVLLLCRPGVSFGAFVFIAYLMCFGTTSRTKVPHAMNLKDACEYAREMRACKPPVSVMEDLSFFDL